MTNAGGEFYSQLVSVGNIKLVSQGAYDKVPDVSFTEEQIALLRPIFETLDTNSDGVLTSAGLGSQLVPVLESLGDKKNEAIALIQDYLDGFNGTINFDQFLEIVEEEFRQAYDLCSDKKDVMNINIDDFVKNLQSPDIHPLVSNLSSLSREQLRAVLSRWDWDGDGRIRYQDFVSAVLDSFHADLV